MTLFLSLFNKLRADPLLDDARGVPYKVTLLYMMFKTIRRSFPWYSTESQALMILGGLVNPSR